MINGKLGESYAENSPEILECFMQTAAISNLECISLRQLADIGNYINMTQ